MGPVTVLGDTGFNQSWPDAAVAIAGVLLVGVVVVVAIWQGLATWRTRIAASSEEAYRTLAEQTARDLRELRERLDDRGPADGRES